MSRYDLSHGGIVLYYPGIISPEMGHQIAKELIDNVRWVEDTIVMAGREVKLPRLLGSMFDKDYWSGEVPDVKLPSNSTTKGRVWDYNSPWVQAALRAWTPTMANVKEWLESSFREGILTSSGPLKYCQTNWYRGPNDYIGWHVDSETGPGDWIFSISLGASRRFGFRERSLKSGPCELELTLNHGDLVVFNYEAAHRNYKHSLFKSRVKDGYTDSYGYGRINVTFRTNN